MTVWCSNDYLGMSQHPVVRAAMHEAIEEVGAGSGGTRNISGTTHYHVELEAELADLHGKEAALLFTSAYIANDSTLSTLQRLMPGLVIFSDETNHASMIEGIRRGGGEKHIFRHNDVEHLEELLSRVPARRPQDHRVRERLFDGRPHRPDRRDLRPGRERYGALTYLDEVHAVGLYGPRGGGIAEARRRHASRRHHQRHARQGLRRDGRLYRRERRLLRRHPLLCAGLHLHHLAGAGHRRRRAGLDPAPEGERDRARAPEGAGRHGEGADGTRRGSR